MEPGDLDEIRKEAGESTSYRIGKSHLGIINNLPLSSATGRLKETFIYLDHLVKLMDALGKAVNNGKLEFIKEFHQVIKDSFEEPDKSINFTKQLKLYFNNREFSRDQYKQYVIALYLDNFLILCHERITRIEPDDYLDLNNEEGLDAKYFDKDFIIPEFRKIIKPIIDNYEKNK